MKHRLIDLHVNGDDRGKLVAVEKGENCPFEVKRAFYIFGTKGDARRGCHANRKSQFLFIALNGSCRVEFSDGIAKNAVLLDSPTKALWLDKMMWKEMFDFSEDFVLLVLSDQVYDSAEYIRDFSEFERIVKRGGVTMLNLSQYGTTETFGMNVPRAYYIFGTKPNVERGFHAHKQLKQLCICVSGACDFVLDDGRSRETVRLDSPKKGLLLGNDIWREMKNFSCDCVLLVLASEHYDEADYIRDYDEFLKMTTAP